MTEVKKQSLGMISEDYNAVSLPEKANGKLDGVAEAKHQLEADKQRRQQEAQEILNQAFAKIQGKDIRCKVDFVIVTMERASGTEKRVHIEITALE